MKATGNFEASRNVDPMLALSDKTVDAALTEFRNKQTAKVPDFPRNE